MKIQVEAWLQAKIMEGYANEPKEITPSKKGTPQGGIISPLLANIALHGLEDHLKAFVADQNFKLPNRRGNDARKRSLSVVRYADDFVVFHENLDVLKACVLEVENWLTTLGLELSQKKLAIRDGRKNFSFLGFQIIQVVKQGKYKVKIHPSKTSCQKFLANVRQIIQENKAASAYQLIMKLRPVILGWANYFKYSECKQDFSSLTHKIFLKLRAWVFRRDTRNGRRFIKNKYFPSGNTYNFDGSAHKDNWILCGTYKSKKKGTIKAYLPHIVWVKSKKHVKIRNTKSPYDGDHIYWANRTTKHSTLPTRVKNLLVRQKNRCPWCKMPFTVTDIMEVDHIQPKKLGGKDVYINLQLLHRQCHLEKTSIDFHKMPTSAETTLQELDEVKVSRPDLKTSPEP
jgi:RNA-directed DNA polymerase